MPTIIDSLVVELGFDVLGMEEGRKKVEDTFKRTSQQAQKTGKDIENAAKQASDFMTRLRNNLLGLFAAFTAGRGLKEFVSDVTNTNAALGRFAATVGMSAKQVAQWRAAGSLMGIEAKDIDSTFSNLTQQFQQFAITGDSSIVPWFRALGISISDAKGNMIPMEDLLMKIARRIEGMDKVKATAFMNSMGIAPGMQQVLLQGPAAMERLLESQKKLAEAQARDEPAARRRQEAWNNFLNQASAVGMVILTELTPAIIALTEAAARFAEWAQEHPQVIGAAFAALTALVLALSAAITITLVGSALATASAGFAALSTAAVSLSVGLAALLETTLPALARAFLAVGLAIEATPVGWIITGIAAIAAAGYLLYKNWDSIAKWWRRLWGGMGEDANEGADQVTGAASKISGGSKTKWGGYANSQQAQADINSLMGMGWSRAQATGIVANLQAESGGKIDAVGDGGKAYGLAQWHPDRQAAFKTFAGKDIRDASRAEQLAFINHELRGSEKRAGYMLGQSQSAEQAARAFNTYYERPADIPGQNASRAAIASSLSGGGRQYAGGYNNQTSEMSIGEVKVYTQATDANGIARDMKGAIARNTTAQQANYGPT